MTHVTIRIPIPQWSWRGIRNAALYLLAFCAFYIPALVIGDIWPRTAVLAGWVGGIWFNGIVGEWRQRRAA